MGRFFDKKSLNMGPIFDPQIPKHGSIFRQNHKNFLGSQNFQKIPKHGSIFWAKSLNMGRPTFFTSKHGLGSRGPGGTPPSKPKSSTPLGINRGYQSFFKLSDGIYKKYYGYSPIDWQPLLFESEDPEEVWKLLYRINYENLCYSLHRNKLTQCMCTVHVLLSTVWCMCTIFIDKQQVNFPKQ